MTNKTETNQTALMNSFMDKLLSVPGMKIDRHEFLTSTLTKMDKDLHRISAAIDTTPIEAGYPLTSIDTTAKKIISDDVIQSSLVSFAAGIPGGVAMAATIPADTMQFYSKALIIAQKLCYLYGHGDLWQSAETYEESKNSLMLFLGVMFGVSGSSTALKVATASLANKALTDLPKKALTKTFYYPIIKKIAKFVGVNVTKQSFGKGVSKVIPVLGGIVSGGITFASLNKMSEKLRSTLSSGVSKDYSHEDYMRDYNHVQSESFDAVDVEYSEAIPSQEIAATATSVSPSGTTNDSTDESEDELIAKLKKLNALKESGAITDAEYTSLKTKLLEASLGL